MRKFYYVYCYSNIIENVLPAHKECRCLDNRLCHCCHDNRRAYCSRRCHNNRQSHGNRRSHGSRLCHDNRRRHDNWRSYGSCHCHDDRRSHGSRVGMATAGLARAAVTMTTAGLKGAAVAMTTAGHTVAAVGMATSGLLVADDESAVAVETTVAMVSANEFGHVFRENMGSVSAVFVSNPSIIRKIFLVEGKYPRHFVPKAWTLYNELHNCKRGLFFIENLHK
ncbi:unnamed protein product [Nesidiocoris tenuis]|uniref:Uncharacterized protein n=1 Tax=Nesidiocoris tenuis TaxID=355587 RepID=A0A6H5HE74_9HEMI|nr:unnamed protein product [Nesidiocoris tenuis]